MSSSNDNDEQQRFALGFLFALIALVVSTVVGVVVYKRAIQPARAPVAATAVVAAPEAVILPVIDVASIKLENGIVKFYFATGKAEPHADGAQTLQRIVDGVKAGKKAVVSGYVDSTGSAAANAEIAKQRAMAVRDLLKGLGVADEQIELQKPADIQGGSGPQARRVEVTLQ